ncbi:hypothetical protein ACHAW6_002015 [Cyclotella cf. meneghiniana]
MYKLLHAGLIANKLLERYLNTHGYKIPSKQTNTQAIWKHDWCPIWFTLVVDNFGVKFIGKEHAMHLKSILESYYPISTDWTGNQFIGITLNWDYKNKNIHVSMPGCVAKSLKQFEHKQPSNPQHAPFPTRPIKYGAKHNMPLQHQWTYPLINMARNSSNKCVENSFPWQGCRLHFILSH